MPKKFLLIILIIVVKVAAAQQTSPDSSRPPAVSQYDLAPIVVTATRTERSLDRAPYAISLIAPRGIQRARIGLSLEEVLSAVPGVVVNNRHNLSQGDRLSIRGIGSRAAFGVRGVKIILDGIPLTMPDGQSQLNNLDLGAVGKIEILRGPNSSLYGNAAAGVIEIQSDLGASQTLQFQPEFTAGSFGFQKWQGRINGQIGRQTYLLSVSRWQLDGYREHSAAKSTALNAIVHRAVSPHLELAVVFNYFKAPYLLNPSALSKTETKLAPANTRFFIQQQGAGKKTHQAQGGITLRHNRDTSRFDATVYGVSRTLLNPIPGRFIELERTSSGLRVVYNRRWHFGRTLLRGTVGADYEIQHDARSEFENLGISPEQVGVIKSEDILASVQPGIRLLDQKESVTGLGVFAMLEFEPHERWLFTLGERCDRYDFNVVDHFMTDGVDDSGAKRLKNFSPVIGFNYRAHRLCSLYGNVATAFQTPTTTELSNRQDGEGGLNPNLQPEQVVSYELGIKGNWPHVRCNYEASFYFFRVQDVLIPYQISGRDSEEIFYRNAGRARNLGVEARLQWMPFDGCRATGAYTLMNFVFTDFLFETSAGGVSKPVQLSGNKIPGASQNRLFANLSYAHFKGAFAEITFQWAGRYFANDFNGPPEAGGKPAGDFVNDSYRVLDLRLGVQRQFSAARLEIFGGINNVLAERYNGSIVPNAQAERFFEPAPGRNWHAGVRVSVGK